MKTLIVCLLVAIPFFVGCRATRPPEAAASDRPERAPENLAVEPQTAHYWVSVAGGPLSERTFQPEPDLWTHFTNTDDVTAVVVSEESLWALSSGGINAFDRRTGRCQRTWPIGGLGLVEGRVPFVDDEALWCATPEGRTRLAEARHACLAGEMLWVSQPSRVWLMEPWRPRYFDKQRQGWTTFQHDWKEVFQSVTGKAAPKAIGPQTWALDGTTLWVGTNHGVACLPDRREQWRWFTDEAFRGVGVVSILATDAEVWFVGQPLNFFEEEYRALERDRDKSAERATKVQRDFSAQCRLVRYDKQDGRFTVHGRQTGLSGNIVNRITAVAGEVWAATEPIYDEQKKRWAEGGLDRFDRTRKRWVRCREIQGEPVDYVTCLGNAGGHLWVGHIGYEEVSPGRIVFGMGIFVCPPRPTATHLVLARGSAQGQDWTTWHIPVTPGGDQSWERPEPNPIKSIHPTAGKILVVTSTAATRGYLRSDWDERAQLYGMDPQTGQVVHYGREQGLTGMHVRFVTVVGQDVWAVTNNGVHRYDAAADRWTLWRNPNQIPCASVRSVVTDERYVWVAFRRRGYYGGNLLGRLDKQTGQWELPGRDEGLPTNRANVLARDAQGRVWVGFSDETPPVGPSALSSTPPPGWLHPEPPESWGNWVGLGCFDGQRWTFHRLPHLDAITRLYPDGQRVWIGTSDAGLWCWEGSRVRKYHAAHEEHGKQTQAANSPLLDNRILSLAVVGDELWIATLRGLSRLNRRTGKWGESIPAQRILGEMEHYGISDIAAYRGHLLGLSLVGIKEYDPLERTWTDWPLPKLEQGYSGVLLVNQDKVWLAGPGPLEYDPQSQLTRVFVRQPGLFPCLAEDGDFLWAGLSRLDRTKLPGLPAEGVTHEPPVRQDP